MLFMMCFINKSVLSQYDNSMGNSGGMGYNDYESNFEQGWKFYGNSSINTSQSSFSNWQGGGINAISIYTTLNLNLIRYGKRSKWESVLNAGYGLMLQGDDVDWFKTDDRLDFNTKIGIKASKKWYYSASVNFISQFQPGYYTTGDSLPISNFLSPGYITGALGFDFNPSPKLSVIIGPVTSKNTVVMDQNLANMGAYGVEPGVYDYFEEKYTTPGKNLRSETGGSINVSYNNPRILKNVGIQSRLFLFSNYLEKPENIDVNFETQLNMQINENISTNLSLNLIYDDDVMIALDELGKRFGPRLQFKQVLAVGLNIMLGNPYY